MHSPKPEDVPAHIADVCRKLRAGGFEAWLVGGAVRDLLAEHRRAAQDFDVATSAQPAEVARVFGRKRTIPTGEKHGTVTVLVEDGAGEKDHVEVTTFRGEGAYSDGRRPDSVEFVRSLEEDLKRRDFTMNAIAYDPLDDRIADPFGGRDDLAARLIRAVGEPLDRFREDGLRAMRAVRFAAQLGFTVDAATEAAIPRALDVFRKVSAERVRDELVKILCSPRPSVGLELMRSTGLLGEVIPELLEGVGVTQNRFHAHDVWHHTLAAVDETVALSPMGPPWIVRLAALLHDVAKPRTAAPREDSPTEKTFYRHELVGAELSDAILRRLKLSTREREHVVNLVKNHMFWYAPEWSDGTVRRFISRVGAESLDDLFALREGDVRARGRGEEPSVEIGELKTRIAEQIAQAAALKVSDLAIGGADVMRLLGCRPGPIVGEVLRRLLERVLDDASLNTYERLEALVPELAREAGAPPGATR
ncbi:MAG TPA: HD domain-containing protein [Polyangia bacterium]|nr:HD domain-containing protein [Polyangia bacterium]